MNATGEPTFPPTRYTTRRARRHFATHLAVPFFLLATGLLPSFASAQSRVAVLPFRGAHAEVTRADVIEAVQSIPGVQLVPDMQTRNAATAMGIEHLERLRERERAALASQLHLQALVTGRITRKRRRRRKEWILTVTVYDAQGASVGSSRWRGRSLGALRAVRRNGARRIGRLVSKASERSRAATTSSSTSGATWWQSTGAQPATSTPTTFPSQGAPQVTETAENESGTSGRRAPAFSLALQGGLLARSLSAQVNVLQCVRERTCDPGMPLEGPTFSEARTYQSGGAGHAELGLSAAFYPGALEASQPIPWLGIYGAFSHSVGVNTSGPACQDDPACPTTSVVQVPTGQLAMRGGVRLRFLPHFEERQGRLGIDVGWGRLQFDFDTAAVARLDRAYIVPPFDYQWAEFGAFAGIELVPRWLELGAEASLRLVYTPGEQARAIWGSSSSTSAWSAGLWLRSALSVIAPGLFAELRVSWAAFSSTFSGQPACFQEPCNDGVYDLWEPWPERNGRTEGFDAPVSDVYRRIALRIGWQWAPASSSPNEPSEGTAPDAARTTPWPPSSGGTSPAGGTPWPPP